MASHDALQPEHEGAQVLVVVGERQEEVRAQLERQGQGPIELEDSSLKRVLRELSLALA